VPGPESLGPRNPRANPGTRPRTREQGRLTRSLSPGRSSPALGPTIFGAGSDAGPVCLDPRTRVPGPESLGPRNPRANREQGREPWKQGTANPETRTVEGEFRPWSRGQYRDATSPAPIVKRSPVGAGPQPGPLIPGPATDDYRGRNRISARPSPGVEIRRLARIRDGLPPRIAARHRSLSSCPADDYRGRIRRLPGQDPTITGAGSDDYRGRIRRLPGQDPTITGAGSDDYRGRIRRLPGQDFRRKSLRRPIIFSGNYVTRDLLLKQQQLQQAVVALLFRD
jgi:hypothetical protein